LLLDPERQRRPRYGAKNTRTMVIITRRKIFTAAHGQQSHPKPVGHPEFHDYVKAALDQRYQASPLGTGDEALRLLG